MAKTVQDNSVKISKKSKKLFRRMTKGKILLFWSRVCSDESESMVHRLRSSQLLATAYGMLGPQDSKEDSSIRDAVNKISKMSLAQLKKKSKEILESKEPVADAVEDAVEDNDADE